MSSEEEKGAHPIFESRFFSVILMLALMAMNIIFIIVIQQFYGRDPALNVLMYLGIGAAGGIVLTFILLGIFSKKNASKGRSILLYLTAGILFVSLTISVIVNGSAAKEYLSLCNDGRFSRMMGISKSFFSFARV